MRIELREDDAAQNMFREALPGTGVSGWNRLQRRSLPSSFPTMQVQKHRCIPFVQTFAYRHEKIRLSPADDVQERFLCGKDCP